MASFLSPPQLRRGQGEELVNKQFYYQHPSAPIPFHSIGTPSLNRGKDNKGNYKIKN
jgi:hypothetical protein